MTIQPLKYISGYLLIEIKGNYTERFLNLCRYHHIYIWNIENKMNNYQMNISINDFRKLKPIIRKTRTKVRILKRFGFPFFAFRYKKRKIFISCAILTCILLYILSFFLWQIDIKGNQNISNETLMEYLIENDISIGKRMNTINCSKIVEDLRADFDSIIWASAYLEGTRLNIHIKENDNKFLKEDKYKDTNNESFYINIISNTDGIIKNIITRKGIPLVHEGDKVEKGDTLVSGAVPILNDAKEIISYQYQKPDADIIAKMNIHYNNQVEIKHKYMIPTKKKDYFLWIQIRNQRIVLGKEKCDYEHFKQKTYSKKVNNYISLGIGERIKCEQKSKNYSIKDCQIILSNDYKKFCRNLEKKGVQILENSVRIYKEKFCVLAEGEITILKPIGKKVNIKIDKQEGN